MTERNGAGCPRCGCNQVEVIASGTHVGRYVKVGRPERAVSVLLEKCRCGFCGHVWSERAETPLEDHAVIYRPVRCPKCGGANTRVTKTAKPKRWHRCEDCGAGFRSVEG
jgi:uncharacterized Zn finger protein